MKKLKWFFKNIWYFRKILWSNRDFDHYYCTDIFIRSLEQLRDGIKKYQNHVNWKEDYRNISKAIRMLKRYSEGTIAFDIAERKYNYEPKIDFGEKDEFGRSKIIFLGDPEIRRLYYNEVKRVDILIRKKCIKYLMNTHTGLISWWD